MRINSNVKWESAAIFTPNDVKRKPIAMAPAGTEVPDANAEIAAKLLPHVILNAKKWNGGESTTSLDEDNVIYLALNLLYQSMARDAVLATERRIQEMLKLAPHMTRLQAETLCTATAPTE